MTNNYPFDFQAYAKRRLRRLVRTSADSALMQAACDAVYGYLTDPIKRGINEQRLRYVCGQARILGLEPPLMIDGILNEIEQTHPTEYTPALGNKAWKIAMEYSITLKKAFEALETNYIIDVDTIIAISHLRADMV